MRREHGRCSQSSKVGSACCCNKNGQLINALAFGSIVKQRRKSHDKRERTLLGRINSEEGYFQVLGKCKYIKSWDRENQKDKKD